LADIQPLSGLLFHPFLHTPVLDTPVIYFIAFACILLSKSSSTHATKRRK